MIGGSDFIIKRPSGANELRTLLWAILYHWPNAVAEDANSDTPAARLYCADPMRLPSEILVYESDEWRASWNKEGATPCNADHMLHILLDVASITVVADDEEACATVSIATFLRDVLDAGAKHINDSYFEGISPTSCIEVA